MLSILLHSVWPYQIFKSVIFRSGMAFLTVYLVIIILMPFVIKHFRAAGITSDFNGTSNGIKPYTGATPIMGGGVLLLGILVAAVLWCNLNQYIVALLIIMFSFGVIGAIDDFAKVVHRRRIESGKSEKKHYSDKADGVSARFRLSAEFGVALVVVLGLYLYVDIDGHLVVPFVPLKDAYPYLPKFLFIPFMLLIIVGGANAVNLTDGMDSLATVPLMTCALFVGAVAYIGGDSEFADRLKIPHLTHEIKELSVLAMTVLSSAMFIFVKAELFLPIVGGIFIFSVLSSIIQRLFFKWMLHTRGREKAERFRFFLRSPYHHHLQRLWTYNRNPSDVESVWLIFLKKIGINPVPEENKLLTAQEVNSRVIWQMHLKSIWLFVIAVLIYFKVR